MFQSNSIFYRMADAFCRYYLVLCLCLVIVLIPAAYIWTKKTTYMASALTQCVTVNEDVALSNLGDSKGNIWVSASQKSLNRLNEWMQDDRPGGFLDNALKAANLPGSINVDPRAKDPHLMAFRGGLKTWTDSDTIFGISMTGNDPAECERMVQAIQSEYIKEVGTTRQLQSESTETFLADEITSYRERLQTAEQALADFRMNHGNDSPEEVNSLLKELANLRSQMDNLLITSQNSMLRRKIVEQQIAKITPTSVLEQHAQDNPINPNLGLIRELQIKRGALLLEGWLATSDKVKAVDAQIQILQQQLEADKRNAPTLKLTRTMLEANPEYKKLNDQLIDMTVTSDMLKAQKEQISAKIHEYEADVKQAPAVEMQLSDKVRDVTVLKAQYENLLQRREQAQINTHLEGVSATSKLRPIGTVFAQKTSTTTKKVITVGGLLIVGLVLGFGIIVFAEWADPTLRYSIGAQRRLEMPVLLALPEFEELQVVVAAKSKRLGSVSRMP